MRKQQTLAQALHLIAQGKSQTLSLAAEALIRKPVGGLPETQQAWEKLVGYLPLPCDRDYTTEQFVAAVYDLSADRYVRKKARKTGSLTGR